MSESVKGASPSCRYFYTDPLAAAWMAKHFGMRFTGDHNEHWRNVELRYGGDATFTFGEIEETPDAFEEVEFLGKQYYIHPDSLHLLAPQIDDLVNNGCCSGYYKLVEYCDSLSADNDVALDHAQEWFTGEHHARIILRDEKPFFWPERETA